MVFKRNWTNGADTCQDTDLEEIGVELDGKQPLDTDLSAFAALAPANDDVLQRKSGSWINRTIAQLKTDLAITLNSLLPSQTSNAGKSLQTDGANTFWGIVSGGGGAITYPKFLIDDYGADPSGVAFSDSAVASALAAMGDNPGILEFGVGTYKLNNTILLDRGGQGCIGQGSQATWLDYRGTSDCIRAWDSVVPADGDTSPGRAGPLNGFTITGLNNTNANICGIHVGDLMWPTYNDIFILDFDNAGAKGMWFEHVRTWSERCSIRMGARNCTEHFVFETRTGHPLNLSSWMYSEIFLSCELRQNQNGVVLRNGAQMIASKLTVVANASAYASHTGALLRMGEGFGESGLMGELFIQAETAGAAPNVACTDMFFGAGGYLHAYGSIRFPYWGGATFQPGNGSLAWINFTGSVWCPSLQPGNGNNSPRNVVNRARIIPSVNNMAFSATPAFDLRADSQFNMTLTAAITSATFSGGMDGCEYIFRFKDNGTARAINLGATPRNSTTATVPTTTVAGKAHYIRGVWNAADSRLDIVEANQQV